MFKALLGGSRSASSSDVRSTTSSGSKLVRRKTDSKSTSSRKSSRGDDRDRGLGDLSAYPGASTGSRRGPVSVAGESVASSYITAEPDPIDDYDRTTHEGNRRHRDGDRDSKTGRRRDRDRSGSRDRDRKRSSRRNVDDLYEEELIRERQRRYPERDYRERSRTYSGDHYAPHTSTAMPSSAPGAQFPVDTAAQHFPSYASPAHHPVTTSADHPLDGNAVSPSYDPHVQQQFPGQFPSGTAQPYYPPSNPAGAAADYYGDQGQSVNDQPGVRPQQPSVIPNSQTHLMTASASANPPPEPSSLGQVGAAAAYFTDDTPHGASQPIPPAASSSKPPKPDKPSIPSKLTRPQSSSAIPTAAALAAAGAVGYGIGEHEESQAAAAYQNDTHSSASFYQSHHNTQQGQSSSSRPPKPQSHSNSYSHSHGIGNGVEMAAAGAAAGYLIGHHHDSSSPTHSSHLPHYHQEHAALHGSNHGHPMAPSGAGAAGAGAYSSCEVQSPGFYPASSLAMQHRHKDPLTKFVDFWRDPEGVGRFEDYTETIGVCKYCFEPGTSSVNAPRKHNYRPRRHSADHYSSSGSSRVNKLSRYQSSDDERNSRKNSSKKSSSWLPGMLAGYAAKSIFTGKEFDDSYSVRSSEKSKYRDSQYYREEDRRSSTSRGVVRRSGRSSSGERHYDSNYRRRRNSPSRSRSRSHSQSRSSSRSGRHSIVKEAALGAAVGGTAMALATHHRDRSRSPARTRRRKDSSSSTSILDVSRSSPKSSGGFTSFFTSTSENRKKEKQKRRSKKTKGFFSFNGSSSSSLDADLAFGTGFAKKPGKLQKQNKKSKKDKDLNATLLGLGATATALAASSHGRSGRNKSQILSARDTRKSRHSPAGSGDDDEWVDAESEEHSSSSISSALAFGASSTSSGSESNGSGGWRWGWRSKKDKKKKQDKEKKSSHTDAILAAGAGALGSAAIASVARRQDSRPPSEASLQQVYPIPTSDPTRFDVAHISPSVVSDGQTPLVRPGSIPLQQPQPYTPVSQAVYSTHGALPGSIPAYSPASVPPIFANDYMQYHGQTQSLRHVGHAHDDSRGYKSLALRNRPHRSDSSPVFPTQEFSMTAPKRRSTARDQASVTFDLTEEQAERERRLDRRNREPREHIRDEPVQLIDREAELDRKDREWAERRERRDRRGYDEEERRQRDHDKDLDSSAWAEAAAIGAIGGALIGSMNFSRRKEDDDYSETSSRRHDRRAERRAERRSDSSVLSRSEFSEPYYGSKRSDEEQEDRAIEDNHDVATSPVRSSNSKPVYEDYADFFAPDEIRPNKHHSRDTPEHEPVEPRVIEAVPSPEREKNNDEPRSDLPQFAREPYEGRDLPWPVPRLHFIDPTPPHSINGSTRESNSPVIPVSSIETIEEEVEPNQSESRDKYDREIEYEARSEPRHDTYDNDDFDPSAHPVQKRDRSSTGSRVSWGPHQTHEYEIPSSSEHDPQSPTEEAFRDLVTPEQLSGGIDNPHGKSGFGDDIEFAAIAAAGAQAAGFDPSVVINDPKYHTRTSPPGSEDEGVYSRGSKWPTTSSAERHHRDLEDDRGTREWSRSRDRQPSVEEVPEEEDRPEKVSTFVHLDDPSTEQPESHPSTSEATEKSQSKASRAESPDNDAFSMPGGFDDGELSRDLPKDDMRSVVSAPLERESAKQKPKKTPRTSIDFETLRYIPSHEQKIVLPLEITEEHKESRRSEDQDLSFSRDKANSAVNDAPLDDDNDFVSVNQEDLDQTPRRKHRQRSSRDRDFDDAASNLSSPGPIYTEDADKSERRRHRSKRESDNFSVDDDVRSAVTLPDTGDKSERRKHRHRSSRDRDDDAASVVSSPAAVSYDDDEKSERRRRRSKRESDTFSVDDDARSVITSLDDPEKSERRKHRHRSSKDRDLDDNASVSSSPARIDETREKRRSNDGKDEKEKDKSGSFLRSLFGSRVSAPEERQRTRSNQSSRSSSLEKKPSRDAVSETGVDDERRRRKKRSSRHRSSSRGDQLKNDASDQEGSTKGDVNLEDYRLRRQEKEERRRQRYGDIVESGKRRDSDKDEETSNSNLKSDSHGQPSLADSPELSADTERNERDSSGLAAAITGAVTATGGMILADKVLHQRPRSRSTSPPGTERALGLEHKSHSRPSSPRMAGDLDQSLTRRRASMARSVTESPTAVPLHFRRPPTSPGLSRAVSVPPSATGRDSPTSASPTQTRHRRPNSVEFRTSREIRPLWLVDRYGTSKGDLVEPGEDLPSLPSSKSSSRSPSFDNLQSLQDDGMHSWEPRDDTAPSMMQGRKPSLTISTSRANDHVEGDLLDSQQATPTAGDFGGTSPGVKKSKPTYEFHSPSELLQNPEMFPEVPAPSLLENLPSAEGSVAGDKDFDEPQLTTDEVEPPQANQSSEGVGFANVVDAAVSAAVEDHDQPIASTSGDAVSQNIQEEPRPRQDPERSIETAPHIAGFASLVSAAVAAKDSNERSLEESVGEPGTAIEEPDSKLPNIESLSKPESDPVGEQLPETTGTVTQPLEPATTESAIQEPNSLQQEPSAVIETVTEEPSTASSSKKKKKKKGKKGQSAVESEPAVEPEEQSIAEPAPSAPTTVNELPDNGSQMPEANAVVTPENNEVPTSESAVLPAEPSRDITSDLPDPTADSTDPPMPEARAPAETTEVPEPTIDATIDPVTLPESAQDTPVDTVEPESNLTPAQKRKAKKAAKKKGKNSIASETTEAAAEEIKPSQDSLEPNTQAVEAVPEIEASVPQPASELDTEKTFEYDEAVTTPAESAARDAEQIENIVDTDQLEPSQDLSEVAEELPKDVEVPLAPLLPEEVVGQAETTDPARQSDETALDGPIDGTQAEEARPETIESEQTVDRVIEAEDAPVPVEQTDDQILQDSIAAPSEFVEEFQNPQSDVPIDTAADRAEPKINETSTEQEVPLTAAQKKKAKKDKKKRKSAGVDENAPASSLETGSETVPAEQTPADAGSITEPAVSTEQINVETPAEDQASPVSDKERTLPGPEGEAAKEEPPALAIDDPVAQSQSETREVPQYDEAPAAESTETTKPTFETEEQSVPEVNPEAQPEAEPVADADADAEPEAKLTPAQKKKAKKDKKKKQKQTSTPSNDIEEPVQTGEETQSENILGEPVPVADKEKNLVEPAAEATKEDPVPVEDEPIGDTRTGLTEVIGDGMAPASEAAEATESVQVPEVTEVAQPAETTESAEATQPGETTQPTEIIESTGPITTTEPTEAIESTEVIEPTEIFEPAEVTQSAEVVEPIEITEPTEATETTEVIETAETVEPAKASQLAEVVEPIEITEVTEPVNLSETAESIQPTEPAAEIADQPIAEIIQESKAAPEAETPHTPAQKKKAKKDKKKKQKQAEAPSDLEIKSVDPESAELQPNEAADAPLHPRETVEPSKEEDLVAEVDTPAGPAAPVEASVDPEWPSEVPRDGKASSPLDDTITGAGTVEDTRVGAGMPDEPKEDILPSASAHNPEPETVASETRVTIDPAVETTANADLPGPAQTTEESQAPMTAAEKRKAKKAKKKKQQQENKEPESPFTEAADPLDSQEVEPRAQSQSEQPEEPFTSDTAGPSDAHESLEQSKDASQSETPANESEPAHQEDVPTETLMAEDATQASPDAAAPIFGEDAAETDESTKDLKTNGEASSEEPLSLIHDATLEDKEPQTLLAEEPPAAVEVPLTAAQKKKAKKDKKKQEKKLSMQADEQDSPASDIPPIEQSEVTEEANATPEVNVPEVDPTTEGSVPAEVVASQGETLPAVTADVPAEAQTEEAKDTAAEEPAIPELDAEPTVETTDVSPPEDTDAATQSAEISEPIEKSEQDSVLPNASSEPPAAQPPSDADPAIYLLDSCSPTAPEDADTISAPEAKEPPSEPEVQAQPEPIEAVTPTTKKEKKKKKKKGKSSSVDEESQSQAANGEDDLQLGDDANVVTAQPVQVTSSDDAPVTYSDKPVISDEPLLNNEDSALSAAAEPEATITEFSEPAAEIVELQQSAEDQPTTTTEPLLNNENSTPSALAEPEATITEFSESIADIGQPESSAEVQFTTTTELPHEGFGTNDASLQDQDKEDAKDSIEKAETEAPMTAAQKRKAKKDKKKRKSVAVEEASTGDQADSQLEMEQAPNAESSEAQDDTTGQAAVDQEAGEAEKVAEVHASETVSGHDSTFGTIATDSASPSAEPPLLEVIDEGVTAQPDTVSEPKEYSLPEPGGEEPEPPKSENHLETVSDATNIVDDSPKTSEEAHPRLDNALPESPADDGLSAKERRKLKKKEKKKSKSADPGEDASSPILPAKDIDVGPEQSQPKPVMVSTTQEPTTDQNNANDGQTSDSLNIDQVGEVQEADEALQPSESHVLDPETSSAAVAEQPTASEQADVHLKEPSPIVESLGQTAEQTTDEPSLTAKEKRKLKKKEKKRQSKALDPDDVPPSSPVAEPQYAPHESKQPDETEFSSRDIAEPVTASSPAEKDGKELQSHDKEAPVTPENELASTDEFLSSQVEQPQPEAESFDEVARPEIMGVTEAEEKREDVQQDEDTHSFAQQSEHQQSGEGEIAENDVSLFKEEGALNSETPVSTEENVREESAQAQPAITVEEELPAETQAADVARVEHVEEPALSKKQKKKDKKKNNNKAQAPDEDSIPTTPSMSLVAEAQSEPIPEHIEESSPHPAVEQSPVVEQHSTAAPMHSSDRALEDKENDKATEALQTNQTADEDRDPPGTDQVAFQTEPPAGELPSTERSIEADKEMNFEDLPSQQDEKEEASENSKHEYDQPVVPDGSTLLYHSQGEDAVAKQDEIPAEPPNEHFTDTVQQDEQAVEINPTSNEEIQPEISEAAIVSTPAPQGNEPQDTVADHTSLDAFDQDERTVPEPSGSLEVAEAHSSAGEQAAEAEAPSKKKKLSKKEKKALAAAAAAAAAALEAETSTIEQPQPEVLAEPVPQMETSDQLPDDNSKDEPPQAIDSRLIVQIPEKEHKIDNEKTQNESGFEVIEATALGELDLERQNVDEAKSAEQAPVELVFEDSVPKLTVLEERTAEDMAIDAPMLERPDVEIHEPASQEVINYLVDSAAKQDEFEEPQIHEAAVEESQLLQSVTDEPAVSVEHLGSREPQVNEMTQDKLHTEEPTITDSVIEPSMIQGSPAPDPALNRKLSKKEKRMLKKQAEANIDGEPQQSDEAPPDLSAATPAVKVSDPYLSNLAEVTALNGNTEPVGLLTEPHKDAEVTTTQQTEPASGYSRSDAIPPTEDSSIVPTGESNLAKNADLLQESIPVQDPLIERSVEAEDAPLSKKLSKKQKRKAKKNTASEISEQKSNDVASSSTTATAIGDTDAEQSRILDNDATAPSTEPEQPKLQEQKQPQDITRDADPASQGSENTFGKNPPVSDWRPADASYQTPSDAQEVEVEPEVIPSLPQITSVTNAEQASRASDTVSLNEQATQQAPHPATDISDETKNVPTTAELEKKGDDEEWPVIEWGDGQGHEDEPSIERAPEPENVTPMPEAETIEEFDESAIPSALQEAWTEPQQDLAQSQEELSPSPPTLSKKDKKKAKKNKRKSEQAAALGGDGHASGNDPDRALEPDSDNTQKIIQTSKEPELETEAPARTTTPGGSKIASLFPELERSGFRRSALDKDVLSPKDQAEDETVPAIQIDRDIAISVSEAPQATAKLHEKLNSIPDVDSQTELQASTAADAAKQANAGHVPSLPEEVELQDGGTSPEQLPPLMDPSRSMNVLDTTSPRRLLPSQMDNAPESPCGLRRTPSVIRGRHQQNPRMWNLEESKESFDATPTASSSPPRSLFGGPREEAHSRPRTPLDPIAEQPGDGHTPAPGRGGTPRLEMKPEHVLPRPHTPVRKFTDNAIAREAWPTPEKDRLGSSPSLDDLLKATQSGGEPSPALTQTPEQGMPVLKPSSSKGKLRRTNRSTSSDLRGASKALDSSQPSPSLDLAQLPSSSSYDPVTDKGKRPLRNMSDVYEGWGETPSSPRSPSRPPSVRRRRSMQHLQEMETRLDQLISENRLLMSARDEAEDKLRNASVARRKSDRALNSSGADLRDREAEVEQLKNSVEWLQREMSRLTQENEGLTASNAALAAAHADEVMKVRETSTRELEDLRSQHDTLSTQMDARVRQEIESALAQKDAELRRLREELEEARDKVKELQQQIASSLQNDTLVFRDEDYFDAACQKLCGHVQQWVLRFSKHSDHRRCRALSELRDEKIADRFDNALLDGSDADTYLSDRVRRRDVFMSVVMTMVWEYIFTRYLFGMDREQRQKLKSLEKQLSEVGPRRAVHRWRATTLTLLSKRPAFAAQRQNDTEAVAQEIFSTLSRVLPPPSQVEAQLLESLRKVLRVAVNLSLEMRTQLAEFIMLPPLQPEYDTNGDLARQVFFNASLMNERSGETTSNDELEAQQAVVRIVLFPLVVKKGNDVGEGDDEVVVCPAQVLIARPGKDKRVSKMTSGDRMSVDGRSIYSAAPSMAPPSVMDMSNVI